MLKSFTLRFDRSAYFDRAHVRGLGFLVGDAGVLGVTLSIFTNKKSTAAAVLFCGGDGGMPFMYTTSCAPLDGFIIAQKIFSFKYFSSLHFPEHTFPKNNPRRFSPLSDANDLSKQ